MVRMLCYCNNMAHFICEHCGKGFKRDRSGATPIRFCCLSCYHTWRKINNITTGQFKKGGLPWNKNLKGIHLSPESEFKKGRISVRTVPIGTVRIRHFKKNNKDRAFIKIAEPNVWRLRCHVVWEEKYGALPKGLLIHHEDRNTLNDDLTNLVAKSRAAHLNEHRAGFEQKRKKIATKAHSKRNGTKNKPRKT